jgi:hypothetical protein
MADSLATIPLMDLHDGMPVELFEQHQAAAERLLAFGTSTVPAMTIGTLDALSRRWLQRSRSPYVDEIAAIAKDQPPGVWYLNLSLEWGCSTGVAADPGNSGSRVLRTLDWPARGLGREVVVARIEGPAGIYYNVTWPGYVGALTVMAPGRFAAAINQAPMVHHSMMGYSADWAINRIKLLRSRALPPAHLLRQMFETCQNYEEARDVLRETPVALPALFALGGMNAMEGCVIERLERRAYIHEAPNAIANHWLTKSLRGRARGIDSHRRHRLINGLCRVAKDGFDWLIDPIMNADTRLAVVMNAAQSRLLVRGFEPEGPATEIFDLSTTEALVDRHA